MNVQAVTGASVAAIRADTLRSMLESDPRVARGCAEELTRQLYCPLDDLSQQAFLSVRERLIRHLLDLATPSEGRHLVVRATQQELADAVGSVREVVTRSLRELHRRKLLETGRDQVVLLDPIALADLAVIGVASATGACVRRKTVDPASSPGVSSG